MAYQNTQILEVLSRIRAIVRRRLLAFGVCALLAGGGLSFLTVVTVDWLLELPPQLRVFGATLFIVGFGWAALRWIVRPMQTRFTLAQIAGKLEQHYPGLNDRLSSTVSFLTAPTDASPALMGQVVTNTNRIVSRLQLHNALTLRPLVVQVFLLVCVLLALATIVAASPDWVALGTRRYVRPFDGVEWPRDIHIEQLTRVIKVPVGESTTVRMRVARGGHADLRGVVHLIDAQRRKTLLAMHRDPNNEYRCEIDAITTDMIYWFQAGDDDTGSSPGRIEVVRRPAVSEAIATVRPPNYADHAGVIVSDLNAGPVVAVVGSVVVVELHTTKPIRVDADGQPEAWLEISGPNIGQSQRSKVEGRKSLDLGPSTFDLGPRPGTRTLQTTLPIDASLSFGAHLVDRDGLTARGGQVYEIEARPDRPPTVVLLEPQAVVETTPGGSVAIVLRAQDDFGFTDLRLVGTYVDSRGEGARGDSRTNPKGAIDLPLLAKAQITATGDQVTALVDYVWDIEPMHLEPPATVVYRIEAADNCPSGVAAGQVGASVTMRLKIISELQFEDRLHDEFAGLQKRIRRAWLDQESLKDETTLLREPLASARGSDRVEQNLANLADRQDRLSRRLEQLSGHFARLRRRMELNRTRDTESIEQVRRLQTELADTARGPMQEAVQAIESHRAATVREREPANHVILSAAKNLDRAIDRQTTAVNTLRDLLQRMDRWGDFRALLIKTRDLADRQQELGIKTAQLGRRTIGRRADELTEAQQGDLRQLHRRQDRLAEELQLLLSHLRDLSKPRSDSASSNDQSPERKQRVSGASAAATENALRAAIAAEITRRMLDASRALETNRLAGAGVHQRAARRGLSRMLAALQERETRRLAELAKRAIEASQAVAHLLARQEELLAATQEAIALGAAADVFVGQSADQGQLQRNARQLGRDLGESVETADAADLVRQASRAMNRAKIALAQARRHSEPSGESTEELQSVRSASAPSDSEPPDSSGAHPAAQAAQQQAVDRLREAHNLLEDRARQAARAAWQRTMAVIRERLEDVRDQQQSINDESSQAIDDLTARGRLDRAIARRAAKLARSQTTLHQTTEQLRRTLARTVVYDRVLEYVLDDMQISRRSLEARRLDSTLGSVQRRIARRLDQLIRALLDAQALPPPDEFAEGGISTAGGATAGSQPRIPAAAELLMIKTMQADLLAETTQLGAATTGDTAPSEEDLRAIETLGMSQRELRVLTEMVVKKAAGRR